MNVMCFVERGLKVEWNVSENTVPILTNKVSWFKILHSPFYFEEWLMTESYFLYKKDVYFYKMNN